MAAEALIVEDAYQKGYADAMADMSETDIMLLGSGSIRVKELGPVVTLGSLKACFPYDDTLTRFSINGKQVKKIFSHISFSF